VTWWFHSEHDVLPPESGAEDAELGDVDRAAAAAELKRLLEWSSSAPLVGRLSEEDARVAEANAAIETWVLRGELPEREHLLHWILHHVSLVVEDDQGQGQGQGQRQGRNATSSSLESSLLLPRQLCAALARQQARQTHMQRGSDNPEGTRTLSPLAPSAFADADAEDDDGKRSPRIVDVKAGDTWWRVEKWTLGHRLRRLERHCCHLQHCSRLEDAFLKWWSSAVGGTLPHHASDDIRSRASPMGNNNNSNSNSNSNSNNNDNHASDQASGGGGGGDGGGGGGGGGPWDLYVGTCGLCHLSRLQTTHTERYGTLAPCLQRALHTCAAASSSVLQLRAASLQRDSRVSWDLLRQAASLMTPHDPASPLAYCATCQYRSGVRGRRGRPLERCPVQLRDLLRIPPWAPRGAFVCPDRLAKAQVVVAHTHPRRRVVVSEDAQGRDDSRCGGGGGGGGVGGGRDGGGGGGTQYTNHRRRVVIQDQECRSGQGDAPAEEVRRQRNHAQERLQRARRETHALHNDVNTLKAKVRRQEDKLKRSFESQDDVKEEGHRATLQSHQATMHEDDPVETAKQMLELDEQTRQLRQEAAALRREYLVGVRSLQSIARRDRIAAIRAKSGLPEPVGSKTTLKTGTLLASLSTLFPTALLQRILPHICFSIGSDPNKHKKQVQTSSKPKLQPPPPPPPPSCSDTERLTLRDVQQFASATEPLSIPHQPEFGTTHGRKTGKQSRGGHFWFEKMSLK
jgi:hypothetical protein